MASQVSSLNVFSELRECDQAALVVWRRAADFMDAISLEYSKAALKKFLDCIASRDEDISLERATAYPAVADEKSPMHANLNLFALIPVTLAKLSCNFPFGRA